MRVPPKVQLNAIILIVLLLCGCISELKAKESDSPAGQQATQPTGRGSVIKEYSSRNWQVEEGLPQNLIQCLEQTHDGYIWVGGREGLARFDGVRFTNLDRNLAPELESASVICLSQTRDGTLWVGTDGNGLLRIKQHQITRLTQAEGLSGDSIRALLQARDGSLLIGTVGGLNRYVNGKLECVAKGELLTHWFIRALAEEPDGSIWVGTAYGLSKIGSNGITMYREKNGLLNNSIKALWIDRNQNLWIGSDGGLSRFKDGIFTHYTKRDGLADNFVSALWEDRNGDLWIGTYGGLNRIVDGKLLTELAESGVGYNQVKALLGDREGNIWMGARDGLYELRERRFTAYTKQNGLAHNNVISVLEDSKGDLWVGTWGGGVNILRDGKWLNYSLQEGLSSDLILSLCEDHDRNMWLGTDFLGGLNRWKAGEKIEQFKKPGVNGAIFVIHEDPQQRIWIGTRNGLGCYEKGQFSVFTTNEGLSDNMVRSLCSDSRSNLWIGTGQGLCRMRDGRVKCYGLADGLSHKLVMDVHFDEKQGLWIGTRGGGLNRLRQGKFTTYTTREGLFCDEVYEILDDGRGFLWMTSSKGIFRVALEQLDALDKKQIRTLTCQHYGKPDGMLTTECTGAGKPAVWKTRDGRLWFGTSQGLLSAEPGIRVNSLAPAVMVEEVLADRELYRSSVLQMQEGEEGGDEVLRIPPGRGELELHYTALSFVAPEKNRFKYKLAGADSDWVDAGTRRVAFYSRLNPGSYRFAVMACNNDGVWNEKGASLVIVLEPHVWDTWWFRGGLCFAIVGAGLVIHRARMARQRAIEQLRMRIAADLHDDIGSNLASIALLSQIEQSKAAPENRDGLNEISRIALNTTNAIREIVWLINPRYDTLDQMIGRMEEVADTLLAGIEHEFEVQPEPRAIHLSPDLRRNLFMIFKEVLHNICKHASARFVRIHLREDHHKLVLEISDDGRGFDKTAIRHGNGLRNMKLRAAQIRADFQIKSEPNMGTTVKLEVKLT